MQVLIPILDTKMDDMLDGLERQHFIVEQRRAAFNDSDRQAIRRAVAKLRSEGLRIPQGYDIRVKEKVVIRDIDTGEGLNVVDYDIVEHAPIKEPLVYGSIDNMLTLKHLNQDLVTIKAVDITERMIQTVTVSRGAIQGHLGDLSRIVKETDLALSNPEELAAISATRIYASLLRNLRNDMINRIPAILEMTVSELMQNAVTHPEPRARPQHIEQSDATKTIWVRG